MLLLEAVQKRNSGQLPKEYVKASGFNDYWVNYRLT